MRMNVAEIAFGLGKIAANMTDPDLEVVKIENKIVTYVNGVRYSLETGERIF